ncbi:PREDICTED: small integral membrane protein 24 [Calidris pugnax]|uniref:small integral membrane protein 24 n=1 Tax=Calidris pugnax TaxID=198806 RepID=UPI00071D881D|nr:PREDICTED: small integral membrane protein 24 [Calidris pugnax]
MPRAPQPLSLLVLLVLVATAQGQAVTSSTVLEPWLLGLTAVVVFLFIVFVLLLMNRLWRIRMRRPLPGHRSPPLSPRRKRGNGQDTPGTDRLERIGHVNPAAEEESDDEERRKATPL